MGRFSYGKPTVLRWGEEATLAIGNFCSISSGVTILLDGVRRPDWITSFPFHSFQKEFKSVPGHPATKSKVIIGNDVWIGINALILSGITIGDGAIIGAQSVVTKDVEPYTIVAGNPAKVIRTRFDNETINELLKIKWWNWSIERIKENMPLLLSNNINEFIKKNRNT